MITAYNLRIVLGPLFMMEVVLLLAAFFANREAFRLKLSHPQSWVLKLSPPYLYTEAPIRLAAFVAWIAVVFVLYKGEATISSFTQFAVVWLFLALPSNFRPKLKITRIVDAGILSIVAILLLLDAIHSV